MCPSVSQFILKLYESKKAKFYFAMFFLSVTSHNCTNSDGALTGCDVIVGPFMRRIMLKIKIQGKQKFKEKRAKKVL